MKNKSFLVFHTEYHLAYHSYTNTLIRPEILFEKSTFLKSHGICLGGPHFHQLVESPEFGSPEARPI